MAASTTTSTARKPARPRSADTCRLTLAIRGEPYSVRPLASEDGRAFRLRKSDGTIHDVAETPHGPTCDCPDFIFHREWVDHCDALGLDPYAQDVIDEAMARAGSNALAHIH